MEGQGTPCCSHDLRKCGHGRDTNCPRVAGGQRNTGQHCRACPGLQRTRITLCSALFALLCTSFGFTLAYSACVFHSSSFRILRGQCCEMGSSLCFSVYQALLILCRAVSTGNDFMEFGMTTTTKCIMEDISQNVIVVGNYAGVRKSDRSPVHMTVKVRDCHATQCLCRTSCW